MSQLDFREVVAWEKGGTLERDKKEESERQTIFRKMVHSSLQERGREEEKHGLGKRITHTVGLHGGY